ncbi:MAG: galactokinase, partial [Planctomycetota bacterium]
MEAAARLRRELLEGFRNGSGAPPRFFFAPGRANLLGAHLDYNGGIVLPVALSKGTYGAFSLRNDGLLRLHSAQFPAEEVQMPLEELPPGRTTRWSAYVEGVLYAIQKKWGPLPGVEAGFCSDLPIAKGLSSSASVESVSVLALTRLMGIDATPDEMIGLAHWAENEYAGVRCGILDQAAILLAQEDTVLLLDCLEQTREHLPLDSGQVVVAVMDTGVRRELARSAFNQRVAECTLALVADHVLGVTPG